MGSNDSQSPNRDAFHQSSNTKSKTTTRASNIVMSPQIGSKAVALSSFKSDTADLTPFKSSHQKIKFINEIKEELSQDSDQISSARSIPGENSVSSARSQNRNQIRQNYENLDAKEEMSTLGNFPSCDVDE